ncbi:hypothetical protein M569_10488, partial [Genlisea aurea]
KKAMELIEKASGGGGRSSGVAISGLSFPPHAAHVEPSFYEYFVLRGVKVEQSQPGFISCSFKVPPRLTDDDGSLAAGAIASMIDEIGSAVIHQNDRPMEVSVDMSISYVSSAKANDELEISSRRLGRVGGYYGTSVLIRNKTTGQIVAEGRHSLFA